MAAGPPNERRSVRQWTNIFPRNTGLLVTNLISVRGIVVTDPMSRRRSSPPTGAAISAAPR
jgi:hypothetical protein